MSAMIASVFGIAGMIAGGMGLIFLIFGVGFAALSIGSAVATRTDIDLGLSKIASIAGGMLLAGGLASIFIGIFLDGRAA